MTVDRAKGGFWITNHLANPILRLLLRSPAGGRLGRRLALLSYRGRRSGQRHELVVQYACDGTQVWIIPGQAERKTWWRNLREPSDVEVRLAGQEFHGRAIALSGTEHPDEVRRGLTVYLRQLPRMANVLGVCPSGNGTPEMDLVDLVSRLVVVRVDLNSDS